MLLPPQRSTLFPYTTLFRSLDLHPAGQQAVAGRLLVQGQAVVVLPRDRQGADHPAVNAWPLGGFAGGHQSLGEAQLFLGSGPATPLALQALAQALVAGPIHLGIGLQPSVFTGLLLRAQPLALQLPFALRQGRLQRAMLPPALPVPQPEAGGQSQQQREGRPPPPPSERRPKPAPVHRDRKSVV